MIKKKRYAFGMEMPGRKWVGSDYRYSFNGKEDCKEISTGAQNYGARMYDIRVGRFFSVDPLFRSYPYKTPYDFAENDVIRAVDLDGEQKKLVVKVKNKDGKTIKMQLVKYIRNQQLLDMNLHFNKGKGGKVTKKDVYEITIDEDGNIISVFEGDELSEEAKELERNEDEHPKPNEKAKKTEKTEHFNNNSLKKYDIPRRFNLKGPEINVKGGDFIKRTFNYDGKIYNMWNNWPSQLKKEKTEDIFKDLKIDIDIPETPPAPEKKPGETTPEVTPPETTPDPDIVT